MNGNNDGRSPEPDEEGGASGEEPRRSIHVLQGNALRTRLTRELGVFYPFVSAGMAFVSLPSLVIAVSEAGGIGMLGAAPEPAPMLQARLKAIQAGTQRPYGVNFILASGGGQDFTTRAHIDACLAARVPVVSFHWALPPADWVRDLKAAGTRVWVQAHSVDFARQALDAGADGLIAQGRQAGGHNRSTVPTLRLVRELRALFNDVTLLAAGGIADGPGAARALHHGADGVWVGTRMVASVEAWAHPAYKQRLTEGDVGDSVFTTAFGPEWPGQRMRVLRNRAAREWAGREERIPASAAREYVGTTKLFPGVEGGNVPYPMPRHSAFIPTPDTEGDLEEMALPASGASMARIEGVLPAGQIVVEMMERARLALENPQGLEADTEEEDDRG
jgi:enoyl-[acyl-carrier protein] reductase II